MRGFTGSTDEIQARRDKVFAVWDDFKKSSSVRRSKLEDSKRLQQFLRDCDELEAWIAQKLQVLLKSPMLLPLKWCS